MLGIEKAKIVFECFEFDIYNIDKEKKALVYGDNNNMFVKDFNNFPSVGYDNFIVTLSKECVYVD